MALADVISNSRVQKFFDRVRSSYWFIPGLMTIGAIILAAFFVWLDRRMGLASDDIPWLFLNQPDGARAVLSTIAGSMITVAGVTFSITIASVSYASGKFGPRLLTNFMQDTGNQYTLGVFVATFTYALLVLRTIQSEAVDGGGVIINAAFVPHLALFIGLCMAVLAVGFLIYFLHHVPSSIHISNVIASIGSDLLERIDRGYPKRIGHDPPTDHPGQWDGAVPGDFDERCRAIESTDTGYIVTLDGTRILKEAREHDLIVCMQFRPGAFVTEGQTLLYGYPAERVDDETADELCGAFAFGRSRTQSQDIFFLFDELIEMVARAMSPSMNDPLTAVTCVNWLASALRKLQGRQLPKSLRFDDDGQLRAIEKGVTYRMLADSVFDQLRPYVCGDRISALQTLQDIAELIHAAQDDYTREILIEHARALRDAAHQSLPHKRDVRAFDQVFDAAVRDHMRGPSHTSPLSSAEMAG